MKTYIENRLKDIEISKPDFTKLELKAQTRELLILLESDFISTLLNEKEIEILTKKAEKVFDIFKTKKVTNKILAEYLNVSEQAVKQYPKNKNELMKLGLKLKI